MSRRWLVCCVLLVLLFPLQLGAQENQGQGKETILAQESAEERDAWLDEMDQEFQEESASQVADPLQPINRGVFVFNDFLYQHFLDPLGKAYQDLAPRPLRKGLDNFFYNLNFPQRLVNNVLQGKMGRAGKESGAFLVNSSVGLAGLLEPSQDIPWLQPQPPQQDLGLTLGKYGFGQGFYLVWPVLGPSTLRDSVGTAGDRFLDPITYVEDFDAYVALKSTEILIQLPELLENYQELTKGALDPYLALRSGYIQHRKAQLEK
ncbi:MAG: VacJ family lipoprotein [Desulfohalobiaceae bacterium]